MTGKEFLKALEEDFKKYGIFDEEIHINSIGAFLTVYRGNFEKSFYEAYEKGGIHAINKLEFPCYEFKHAKPDDAEFKVTFTV